MPEENMVRRKGKEERRGDREGRKGKEERRGDREGRKGKEERRGDREGRKRWKRRRGEVIERGGRDGKGCERGDIMIRGRG